MNWKLSLQADLHAKIKSLSSVILKFKNDNYLYVPLFGLSLKTNLKLYGQLDMCFEYNITPSE